jgi:DNA modification methylase
MELVRNLIIKGNCPEVLPLLSADSVGLANADPPYNLQLTDDLRRADMARVEVVNDQWDKFDDFKSYD